MAKKHTKTSMMIFTIGHPMHSIEEFEDILKAHGIEFFNRREDHSEIPSQPSSRRVNLEQIQITKRAIRDVFNMSMLSLG